MDSIDPVTQLIAAKAMRRAGVLGPGQAAGGFWRGAGPIRPYPGKRPPVVSGPVPPIGSGGTPWVGGPIRPVAPEVGGLPSDIASYVLAHFNANQPFLQYSNAPDAPFQPQLNPGPVSY